MVTRDLKQELAEVTGVGTFESSLKLLSEPEAAVLSAIHDIPNQIGIGDQIMVIDIGGGTTDITCHVIGEKQSRMSFSF